MPHFGSSHAACVSSWRGPKLAPRCQLHRRHGGRPGGCVHCCRGCPKWMEGDGRGFTHGETPRKAWVSLEIAYQKYISDFAGEFPCISMYFISHTNGYFMLFYRFNFFSDSDIQRTRMGIWWVNRTRKW